MSRGGAGRRRKVDQVAGGPAGERPTEADEHEKARPGLIRRFPPTFETPGQVLRRPIDTVRLAYEGLPLDQARAAGPATRLRGLRHPVTVRVL